MGKSMIVTVSLVLVIVGLFVIFSSVSWGSQAANTYLRSQGGGMDTAQFIIVLQEYIGMYKWLGGILSLIGGLALVKVIA